MPPDPPKEFVPPALNARASSANAARLLAEPLHPVPPNAIENPGLNDTGMRSAKFKIYSCMVILSS